MPPHANAGRTLLVYHQGSREFHHFSSIRGSNEDVACALAKALYTVLAPGATLSTLARCLCH